MDLRQSKWPKTGDDAQSANKYLRRYQQWFELYNVMSKCGWMGIVVSKTGGSVTEPMICGHVCLKCALTLRCLQIYLNSFYLWFSKKNLNFLFLQRALAGYNQKLWNLYLHMDAVTKPVLLIAQIYYQNNASVSSALRQQHNRPTESVTPATINRFRTTSNLAL